ncbi:hypothetical protein HMI56_004574 [Coelomomyces lativittatus]|nr:hypothetical protein HMI56_004574 [Coelomomyces lativittatus]
MYGVGTLRVPFSFSPLSTSSSLPVPLSTPGSLPVPLSTPGPLLVLPPHPVLLL